MSDSSNKSLSRRGRDNQVLGRSGKPLLVIVEGENIGAMIDAGLGAIGGLERIIGDHREVLLKPNTNQRDPFPSITAPETLRAVASHCRKAGAKHIIVHEDHKFELDLYYSPEELPGLDIQISFSPDASHYVLVEYEKWQGDMDRIVEGVNRVIVTGDMVAADVAALDLVKPHDSLRSYGIPTMEIVGTIEAVAVENPDPLGPFGAKGIAEAPVVPVAAAVANAIEDAVGARLKDVPLRLMGNAKEKRR